MQTMKAMMNRLLLVPGVLSVVFGAMLLEAPTVSAYYDPGVQRWINRDPLEEQDGIDLYKMAYNNPVSYVDRDGLQVTAPPPAPATPKPKPPVPKPPVPKPPMSKLPTPKGPKVGGAIGVAIICGEIGAHIIAKVSEIIWPEPSPDPLPFNFPTTTCFLSPVSPPGVCLYVCRHTGNPDQNQYPRRAPGPNGCPDTITVRNPYK